MEAERREFEMWRERDWRCEWWSVGGHPQVRLYFGAHLVNELAAGPKLNLHRQTSEWLTAVHADRHRT